MLTSLTVRSGSGSDLSDTSVPFALPGEPGNLITGKTYSSQNKNRGDDFWCMNSQNFLNGKPRRLNELKNDFISAMKLRREDFRHERQLNCERRLYLSVGV